MKPPAHAFILAAGFGTRLLPLTKIVPKPLLPLGGIPMIERALFMVRRWGVREVCVNVHHGADAIIRHLRERRRDGLRIAISFEPEILGTGGALSRAAWWFKSKQPFWMLNADVAANLDPAPLHRAFRPGRTIASAWLMATRGPRTVECRNGVITHFQSAHPGTPGTYTFCGVHLVDPAILHYVPAEGFSSIIAAYQKAMTGGWIVAGAPIEKAYWADIGTPAQYLQAERDVRANRTAHTLPPARTAVRPNPGVGIIYGPDVPEKNYAGIMALPAAEALAPAERALISTWRPIGPDTVACPLAPRGSARTFTRVYAKNRTALLIAHQPGREENDHYTRHARFLARLGLPAPRVLAEDAANRLALFEDVGIHSVQDLAPGWNHRKLQNLYTRVLDALLTFHETGERAAKRQRIPLMPPFDAALYRWEHDLFLNLFLRDRHGVADSARRAIADELETISRQLARARPVLVHRDLQSSNILLRGSRWAFIDFQGMRYGPAVYDLASLLCDPYIDLPTDMRSRLLTHYAERADPASLVHELFWPAAVQRLGQALGAYARLSARPETARFAAYIPPALERMKDALARLPKLTCLRDVIHQVKSTA
ncbi:MAG TPA: phosphotransferase [Kiritimatiellia bacterium]|nr:phosphotransferase [Kiritimatiellia bacterium]